MIENVQVFGNYSTVCAGGVSVQQYPKWFGKPVAFTSVAFLIGMLLLPFGEETRGKPLPA